MKAAGEIPSIIKAAIYIRISTDEDLQRWSLGAQERELSNFCEKKNWPVYRVYRDTVSGSRCSRPGLDSLRDDMSAGFFSRILVVDQDRLSRMEPVDWELLKKEIKENEVRLVTPVAEVDFSDEDNELVSDVFNLFARHQRRKIKKAMKRGRAEAVKNGRWLGKAPYGRRLDPATGKLLIDEVTAPVARRIFELYARGCGAGAICRELGPVPGPGGAGWSSTAVLRVIRQVAHRGDIKFFVNGQHIYLPGAHEPTVPPKLFDRCQKLLQAKKDGCSALSAGRGRSHRQLTGQSNSCIDIEGPVHGQCPGEGLAQGHGEQHSQGYNQEYSQCDEGHGQSYSQKQSRGLPRRARALAAGLVCCGLCGRAFNVVAQRSSYKNIRGETRYYSYHYYSHGGKHRSVGNPQIVHGLAREDYKYKDCKDEDCRDKDCKDKDCRDKDCKENEDYSETKGSPGLIKPGRCPAAHRVENIDDSIYKAFLAALASPRVAAFLLNSMGGNKGLQGLERELSGVLRRGALLEERRSRLLRLYLDGRWGGTELDAKKAALDREVEHCQAEGRRLGLLLKAGAGWAGDCGPGDYYSALEYLKIEADSAGWREMLLGFVSKIKVSPGGDIDLYFCVPGNSQGI